MALAGRNVRAVPPCMARKGLWLAQARQGGIGYGMVCSGLVRSGEMRWGVFVRGEFRRGQVWLGERHTGCFFFNLLYVFSALTCERRVVEGRKDDAGGNAF